VIIAINVSQFLLMISMDLYCTFDPEVSKVFPSFIPGRRAFENLGTFLKITLPSALMQGLRWWALEFTLFFAGMLGTPSTSATSITLNCWLVIVSITFGLTST